MRRGKKPTRKQKIRLGQAGLAPENWLVVKQKANGELIILNKDHDTIRVIPDELCRKEQQHEGATAHLPTVWASIRRAARAVASGQPDGHLPEVRHDGGAGGHAEAGNATGADAAGRVRHGQPLGD